MSSSQTRSFVRSSAIKAPQRRIGFLLVQSALIGLTISAAQAQEVQAPAKADASLPTVNVQGEKTKETATSPVIAKRGSTATKTDTPLAETPRSISVVTRDQMIERGAKTAEEALRYTAGVLTEVTGYDLRYQSITIRGFSPTMYRDGMRTFASGSYSDWVAEVQGLERIEVLKGPASVLYGQGSSGGIINQISKRPTADMVNEVGVSVGSHQRYQATLDVGGQLNSDGSLLYRVNGLSRDSKTQTDYSKDDRFYLAPSLTWRPNAQTSLTLLTDFTRDRMTPKSWWPWQSLSSSGSRGDILVSRFAGEPGFDHYKRDMAAVGYLLEHEIDSTWTVRQNLRYSDFKLDYQHVYSYDWASSDPTNPLIQRDALVSRTHGHALTVDTQVNAKLDLAGVSHNILLGFDLIKFSGQEDLAGAYGDVPLSPDFDPFNPVYGAAVSYSDFLHSTANLKQFGLYAQDQMKIDRLVLNVGVRRDRATGRSFFEVPLAFPVTRSAILPLETEATDAKTTYNAGALYKLGNGWSPYVNYSTSFEPPNPSYRSVGNVNGAITGRALKPETGQQFELGVKYELPDSRGFVTASVFDLRKKNTVEPDPDDSTGLYSVQTGEIRSRGLELEVNTALTNRLNLMASYTYLDAVITQSDYAAQIGQQPEQTAKNTAKAWLDYKMAGALQGWRLGGGLRYIDKVLALVSKSDAANNFWNDSYMLVDAAIRYQAGPYLISLTATNLLDKVYAANRAQFYGEGRSVQASLVYRW